MKTGLCLTAGIFLLAISDLSATTLYVSPASMNPTPPYATWTTAATNIQNAVDAAQQDAIVLVTNGVYAGGVTINKALTLIGLNAAQSTVIDGAGATRCLSITNGVKVFGFTLTNGWADNGGGLWCNSTNAWLTNCVIAGNSATQNGGGAYGATLYNCRVTGNSATNGYGGGAFASMLYNCTVTGNSAASAGGASGGIAYNSILYFNTAPNGANYLGVYYLLYCCTIPLPDYGDGSFTNAPAFVDYAVGNLHLQPTSPCISAGNNSYAHGETDLDGNPRISEDPVDVGAYEFQPTGPPSISLQPLSQSVYSGTNVSLKAAAYGSPPLSWQWWFNDTAIPSATNSSIALHAVTTNQAGNYFAVVTNILGAATSRVAVLQILTAPPSVTLLQPVNQTVQAGSNVTLTVSATGSLPLSWQWNFNGAAILGATNSILSLPSVTTNQAGTYSVVVTNTFGSVTTQVAVLTVVVPPPGYAPVITLQPVSQTVSPGDTVAFTAQASGSMPMVWQWLFNNSPVSGNSSNLTLNAVTVNQAGIYSVKVTNAFGTAISADATLTVRQFATAYVWQDSPSPIPPYTNWVTAAHTIQDAVDASSKGDTVLVTNGVYAPITVTNPLTLLSINGPPFTIIDGGGTTPCAKLFGETRLSGFTMTNGLGVVGGGVQALDRGSQFLTNCVLIGNRADLGGGGALGCTLYNCTLTGNWAATNGEAAINSALYNCTISGNSGDPSYSTGAAVYGCALDNCAIMSNSLAGADSCTLYGCTLAANQRGGALFSALYNSIAYYNQPSPWAPGNPNYGAFLVYCCTIPMPTNGFANITNEPLFVDPANGDFHLQLTSPCVNAGNIIYVSTATDLDANPRIIGGRVDMGAYESNFVPPPPIVVTRYVSQNSVNPAPPYTNWDTAAHIIQVAVDAANAGDEIVVSNGVYTTGGRSVGTSALANRVVLDKPLTVRSLNGPDETIIQGDQVPGTTNGDAAIRCVYMTSNTILSSFTFTKGATLQLPPGGFGADSDLSGGGIYCDSWGSSVAKGCKLVGNSASQSGGGAFYCGLDNCLIVSNSSANYAGGAGLSSLTNCTVLFNSAFSGGGVAGSLFNCIVYYNQAASGYDWEQNYLADKFDMFLSSCITPVTGFPEWLNIGNAPLFVDPANGDFHLQSNSPCINAGNNALVSSTIDLDGNPRVVGGKVDIGAYESGFTPPPPITGTRYVWQGSPNPAPPYTNWDTAAHVIQDAVDAASPGDAIVVTNGLYATGGRTVPPSAMTNRVAVDKALTLQSVNGPQFTTIQGFQVPGTTNAPGAVRCVYLATGATLSGFTLTNGATYQLGGNWATEQSGGGVWCASAGVMVTNCILAGNSAAYSGAGANGGTLVDCLLVGNKTTGANGSGNSVGAGANNVNLFRCTITGNSAGGIYGSGGGASGCNLTDCLISYNSASDGGGGVYWQCSLTNCTVMGNSAGGYGGGARGESGGSCILYNCFLTGNTAGSGGGASGSQLYNCTLTGNSVDHFTGTFAYSGGGVSFCTLLNCIIYYNAAVWGTQNYDPASTFNNCCTTPLPNNGSGNISFEPQLATASHLSANSPCRGAGLPGSTTGLDIDGESWSNPPSIGCDEYHAGATTGPLSVAIETALTNTAVGTQVPLKALIEGQAATSVWDFGDGTVVSNRPYASHIWMAPGDYAVVLLAYNDSQPDGVAATVAVHVAGQVTHYVDLANTNAVPPFISWATAATNIQDAVDAAATGDEIVVADGIYAVGGRAVGTNQLLNRVAVTNLLSLRSANGPQFTFIQGAQAPGGGNGGGAIRCVYLANGSSLSGFTLTNGATRTNGNFEMEQAGGGVFCESAGATLSNCVVIGNTAFFGGGAYRGTLYNCLLNTNSATGNVFGGGGAYESILYNCTLTGNSANSFAGGGVSGATLYNSIIYYNTAPIESNYVHSFLNYCATTPTPTNGVGNAPLFVDGLGGNFHLQAASPCINAGNNAYRASSSDFDGNPRIAGGTVDIGAYEYQSPTSAISYDWLDKYGLPTDGSADFLDPDGDGMNNWQEWVSGTNPTNALSALSLLSVKPTGTNVNCYLAKFLWNNLFPAARHGSILPLHGPGNEPCSHRHQHPGPKRHDHLR